MQINNLNDLLKHELQDLYSAENQIIEALPKMMGKANHDQLKRAFQKHLDTTKQQKKRLDDIADHYNFSFNGHKCKGIEGIIKEAEQFISENKDADPDVLDAALITLAQRVEHYEIAGYGTAAQYAEQLDMGYAKDKLGETLQEEEDTDSKLKKLAKGTLFTKGINQKAIN